MIVAAGFVLVGCAAPSEPMTQESRADATNETTSVETPNRTVTGDAIENAPEFAIGPDRDAAVADANDVGETPVVVAASDDAASGDSTHVYPALPPWVEMRETNGTRDVVCHAEWAGGRKYLVETTNVRRLTLNFNRLPDAAPPNGPWIVRVDGQNIEITGFRSRVVDVVRSDNGNWEVDKALLKKRGSS